MKKISLIITILNEEKTIIPLLKSIEEQIFIPNEVIIVDGGSKDTTVYLVKKFAKSKPRNFSIIIFEKKGNRSIGRNFAISKAKNTWIAITDAGCILDKNWLKQLVNVQEVSKKPAIAGYYSAIPKTPLEKSIVPYVLVMPDRVDEKNFLPATRSMLLNKNIWNKIGGFDESLSDNEDYAFAKKLKECGVEIGFSRNAIAFWMPPKTISNFAYMIFRFARGDIYAGIIRPKVVLIFARYLIGLLVFIWVFKQALIENNFWFLFAIFSITFTLYFLWSIYKNYRYVRENFYWLPILQIVSDFAVIWGSLIGLKRRLI